MKSHFITISLLVCTLCACKVDSTSDEQSQSVTKALDQSLVNARFPYLLEYGVDSTAFPRSMEENGDVRGVPSKDWTSGFFPGNLIYIYQITGDPKYLSQAEAWLPFIRKEKKNAKTHDMGFKVFCSYGNVYKATANSDYADVIIASASTLSTRFNPAVGCIKSWDFGKSQWTFPVIIDNMMNLELLFEATIISGDSTYYQIADSHAATTLKNHFRQNNSSYHVIDYDPETGEILNKLTHQGLHAESSWARGQAWGLYGFTMAYRYTKKSEYLKKAIEIAQFLIGHPQMPDDLIPYWDLDDPKIPNTPKDASAAAVIASALLELAQYSETNQDSFRQKALSIISTLSSEEYIIAQDTNVPFILKHSTGNMPKTDEIDLPIVYADYYFLEALVRANAIQ